MIPGFDERRKFAPGDRVRPTVEHRGDPRLPMGKVLKVVPFGKGQAIKIEGDKRSFLSGFYELEPASYDGNKDFAASYDECLREVRERKAAGGPGWPKEAAE